jgi:hypothetical protein
MVMLLLDSNKHDSICSLSTAFTISSRMLQGFMC